MMAGGRGELRLLTPRNGATLIAVRVQPRAQRSAIVGERNGRLLVQVTSPPVEGRANDAACQLIAKALKIGARRVTVEFGARSRDKLVRVDGVEARRVAGELGLSHAQSSD